MKEPALLKEPSWKKTKASVGKRKPSFIATALKDNEKMRNGNVKIPSWNAKTKTFRS